MKKIQRRVISLAMMVVMLLSVVPVNVLAAAAVQPEVEEKQQSEVAALIQGKEILQIKLVQNPKKMTYLQDQEELDVTGGIVELRFNDDTYERIELTRDMVTGFDNSMVGENVLTITYGGKSCNYTVQIIATRPQDKLDEAFYRAYPETEIKIPCADPVKLDALIEKTGSQWRADYQYFTYLYSMCALERPVVIEHDGRQMRAEIEIDRNLDSRWVTVTASIPYVATCSKNIYLSTRYVEPDPEFVNAIADDVWTRKLRRLTSLESAMRFTTFSDQTNPMWVTGESENFWSKSSNLEREHLFDVSHIRNSGGQLLWPTRWGKGDWTFEESDFLLKKGDVFYGLLPYEFQSICYYNVSPTATEGEITAAIEEMANQRHLTDRYIVTAEKYVDGMQLPSETWKSDVSSYKSFLSSQGYNAYRDNLYVLLMRDRMDSSKFDWTFIVVDDGKYYTYHIQNNHFGIFKDNFVFNDDQCVYDGAEKYLAISGDHMTEGLDYTVSYENNVSAGTATAIITGCGEFYGEARHTFEIKPMEVSEGITIAVDADGLEYDGTPKTPAVVVSYKDMVIPAEEYTVEYRNNTDPGTAQVIVMDREGGNFVLPARSEQSFEIQKGKPIELNGVKYATLSEALKAAKRGDTVRMIGDVKEELIIVRNGVTLDLNGHILEAAYLSAFNENYVIDRATDKGLLKIAEDNVIFAKDNPDMPIWNGVDGYQFAAMNMKMVGFNTPDGPQTAAGSHFKIAFKPLFGKVTSDTSFASKYFTDDGCTNNKLKIKLRLTWRTEKGAATQDFTYSDSFVQEVYRDGRAYFTMYVGGLNGISDLRVQTVVRSGTSVQAASEEMIFDVTQEQ